MSCQNQKQRTGQGARGHSDDTAEVLRLAEQEVRRARTADQERRESERRESERSGFRADQRTTDSQHARGILQRPRDSVQPTQQTREATGRDRGSGEQVTRVQSTSTGQANFPDRYPPPGNFASTSRDTRMSSSRTTNALQVPVEPPPKTRQEAVERREATERRQAPTGQRRPEPKARYTAEQWADIFHIVSETVREKGESDSSMGDHPPTGREATRRWTSHRKPPRRRPTIPGSR